MTKQDVLELKKEYLKAEQRLQSSLRHHNDLLQKLQQECHHETVIEMKSGKDYNAARYCTFCHLLQEGIRGRIDGEFGPLTSTQPTIVSFIEFYEQTNEQRPLILAYRR